MQPSFIYLLSLHVKHESSRVIKACSCPDMLRGEMATMMETDNAAAEGRQTNEVSAAFDDLKSWSEPEGWWDGDEVEMIKLATDWRKNNIMEEGDEVDTWVRSDHTWSIVKMPVQHPAPVADKSGIKGFNSTFYGDDLCGGQMSGLS